MVTGFIGATQDGRITTLGRNSSDFSGALIAHVVDAEELVIWTDVDGIYTANPKESAEAMLLHELSYDEAHALAASGAKVLHPHVLPLAAQTEMTVWVKNTFQARGPGYAHWLSTKRRIGMSARANSKRWRAGVLGATGMVGQRLVKLLSDHPWFELSAVAASERSTGKTYADAARWHLEGPIPERARGLVVKDLEPTLDCDFVFSALDSSVAGEAEERFARAGYPVVSNSKNHRMDADVPLLIPEVNAAHVNCIPVHKKLWVRFRIHRHKSKLFDSGPGVGAQAPGRCVWFGEIVCGDAAGGLRSRLSRSAAMDALERGSVHQRRRKKMEAEPQKLLGKWDGNRFIDAGWESARIVIACRWSTGIWNACPCG